MVPPPTNNQSNLPIIQKATEAYKLWHVAHNKFSRLSKFSLGTKIDTLFTELMENLYLARYSARDEKLVYVKIAVTRLDLIKFFIQVALELKLLDPKQFAALSAPLSEIGAMVGSWQKQLQT